MDTFRKVLIAVAALLLPISLFTFGTLFSLHQAFGTSDTVKGAVERSGIYDIAVHDLLEEAQQETGAAPGEVPLNDAEVRRIVEQAFPPQFLQRESESLLDGMYAWMQGKNENLAFQLNLGDAKIRLADGLAGYAEQRLNSLPTCTSINQISRDTDPFSATCIPPNFDKATAIAEVRNEILNSRDFLEDPNMTAADIKDEQGRPLQEQLQGVPDVYAWLVRGIWISGILSVLCIAALALASRDRRTGLGRLGKILISVGVVSALFAAFSSFVLSRIADSIQKSAESTLQERIIDAVQFLTQDLRNWWLGYGLLLIVLGIGALIGRRFLPKPAASAAPQTPEIPRQNSNHVPPSTSAPTA